MTAPDRPAVAPVRRVRIEKLAPTGEGIARTADGVGFIDRALPGELVETMVYQVKKNFWRGSLRAVLEPSASRVSGPHADCPGCDWAHFEPAAAGQAKRELFRETMARIGRLDPGLFGELSIAPSPPEYRLRARLHVAGEAVGYFAPGTHRVVPGSAQACAALSPGIRAAAGAVGEASTASDAGVFEVAFLEGLDGRQRLARVAAAGSFEAAGRLADLLGAELDGTRVDDPDGRRLHERGAGSLTLTAGGRPFSVSAGTFFQGNRFLLEDLVAGVHREAAALEAGDALDAYGGAGLFAGALLSAGHRVTSIEADTAAGLDAERTRTLWPDAGRWVTVPRTVEAFLGSDPSSFACVVADPPRSGLGEAVARELGRRAEKVFVYVSCDPATLARDLAFLKDEGLEIRRAALLDLFSMTHRVEAVVALERAA